MDSRAVAPVVGKLLAAGLAVLYIAGMTSLLLGGVVPEYRTQTADELSERVLADAAAHVERSVPDTRSDVDVRLRRDLPATIRDASYRLVLRNDTLILDHPDDMLDSRTSLSMPSNVTTVESSWESGDDLMVRVAGTSTNRTVELGAVP
ncbi:MAG: hypothetical protein V5A39_14105 [Haloarculaceae archaeon]